MLVPILDARVRRADGFRAAAGLETAGRLERGAARLDRSRAGGIGVLAMQAETGPGIGAEGETEGGREAQTEKRATHEMSLLAVTGGTAEARSAAKPGCSPDLPATLARQPVLSKKR